MSCRVKPGLLIPGLVLSASAHSLGLGELQVSSALNEPLAAQIDIIGTSADDLSGLRAAVANRDTFLRYGLERPPFLASATFTVAKDRQGRPVLSIRSAEPCTEPLVNLLLDLHWSNGELIREYTLLLDPAESVIATKRLVQQTYTPEAPSAPVTPVAPNVPSAPSAAAPVGIAVAPVASAAPAASATHVYKVARRDTLGAIAHRAGAKTDGELIRLMVAIYHANPRAFNGNMNRLRVGARLNIPAQAEWSSVSTRAASQEVHAQTLAWHGDTGAANTQAERAAQPARSANEGPTAASPAAHTSAASDDESLIALQDRVKSLAEQLEQLEQQQHAQQAHSTEQATTVVAATPTAEPIAVPAAPAAAAPHAPATPAVIAATPKDEGAPTETRATRAPWYAAGMGILAILAGAGFMRGRYGRKAAVHTAQAPNPTGVADAMAHVPTSDPATAPAAAATATPPALKSASGAGSADAPAQPVALEYSATHRLPRASARIDEQTAIIVHEGSMPHSARLPLADTDDTEIIDIGSNTASTFIGNGYCAAASGETTVSTAISPIGTQTLATAILPITPAERTQELPRTVLQPDLDIDLDRLESSETHVQMPSKLNENAVFTERRSNVIDVLRVAVEREPGRADLRLKLLELYLSTASINRQSFIDMARELAGEPNFQSNPDWDKVVAMGRQIAPDEPLFALDPTVAIERASPDDLANCA